MSIILSQSNKNLQVHAGALLVEKIAKNLPLLLTPNISPINRSLRADRIPDKNILMGVVLTQSFGLTNFHDIEDITNDDIVNELIGSISEETYRQRLDSLASNTELSDSIDRSIIYTLKKSNLVKVEYGGRSYYTLDIDVTPMLNPNNKKEGVELTYKKEYGYAPICAYLNNYAVAFELRPGSQHSELGAEEFLERCLNIVTSVGIDPSEILLRVDSAHDAEKFISLCLQKGIKFIVKRNFRREKNCIERTMTKFAINNVEPISNRDGSVNHYYFTQQENPTNIESKDICSAYEVREISLTEEKNSFLNLLKSNEKEKNLLFNKYEVDGYWTNITIKGSIPNFDNYNKDTYLARTCVYAYNEHATSEQFHSELKSDMKIEQLPSGKFATNKLYLGIAAITFNILRLIGDKALALDSRFQHHKNEFTQRIRIGTVIQKLCLVACQVVSHARNTIYQFGKSFKHYKVFNYIYLNT